VPKQKVLEEHEYNLFTQSLDSNKKLEYSDITMRIIANVMVDIRSKTMERGASFVQQYPLKKGLKVFGEAGIEAALKEVDQLYKRSCFTPINVKDLSNRERRKAQVAIMLLTQKTISKEMVIKRRYFESYCFIRSNIPDSYY